MDSEESYSDSVGVAEAAHRIDAPPVTRVLSLILAGIFAWSSVVKLIDPDAFGIALWKIGGGLLSPASFVWLGGAWAIIEWAMAVALVRSPTSRRNHAIVICFCVMFSVVLIRLFTMTDPPGCGCLTVAAEVAGPMDHTLGMIRIAGLFWLAWIALRSCPNRERTPIRLRPISAGFTLIETLVVISLIALLVGLLLPAIEGAFVSAKQSRQAIRQRETYAAVMAYTEDYKNTFPYFGTVGNPYGPVTIGGVTFENPNYFGIPQLFWGTVLVPHYIPERSMLETVRVREGLAAQGVPGTLVAASSVLTGTAYAAPRFFHDRDEGEPLDYTHFRATRQHEMIFPSDKVLLISWWGGGGVPDFAVDESYKYPATFGDSSTTWFSYEELVAMPTAIVPFGGGIPTHTTEQGLAGRDR